MCAFGAPAQKWTMVAGTGSMASALQGLDTFVCTHGGQRHPEKARGFDHAGASLSAKAAAYPH